MTMSRIRAATPAFLRLPQELHDDILSRIALPRDLLNLALASSACSKLVIPRHIEYRIIRIRYRLPSLWAHLAKRADLARNVREVHLCERSNYLSPDHAPTTLVKRDYQHAVDPSQAYLEEDMRVRNICVALGHMDQLEVFTWSANTVPPVLPTVTSEQEDAILSAVVARPALEHLALSGPFAVKAPDIRFDQRSLGYPIWNVYGLTSLSLVGDVWARPLIAPHVKSLLKLSPLLEFLEVAMELSAITDCRFPILSRLKIFLQAGVTTRVDQHWVKFLANHPSITELFWFPIGTVKLEKSILPNLKYLQSTDYFADALGSAEPTEAPKRLERLDMMVCKESEMINTLRYFDAESLKMLKLSDFATTPSEPSVDGYLYLPKIFPNLMWLSVPNFPLEMDEWVDYLSQFPLLEVFRGQSIWLSPSVGIDKNRMHTALMKLSFACPKLRLMDHCDYYEKRRNWQDIVFTRTTENSSSDTEDDDKEHISYEVRKPLPRLKFDAMDGAFE